jgi:hypothetical protein
MGPAGATHLVVRQKTAQQSPDSPEVTDTVRCHPGERATGGGYSASHDVRILTSAPTTEDSSTTPTGWGVAAESVGGGPFLYTVRLWVICSRP